MNNNNNVAETGSKSELLKDCLQYILIQNNLDAQRRMIELLAKELDTDILSCAAALLHLHQPPAEVPAAIELVNTIKMVRYRLDVGSQHQLSIETLKRVLVEESGVDKNNINNITIRGLYTLIDLPDAMPPDIFQHLKTVEINARPLAIKRVKSRFKKRSNFNRRRSKSQGKSSKTIGDSCPD